MEILHHFVTCGRHDIHSAAACRVADRFGLTELPFSPCLRFLEFELNGNDQIVSF